MNVFSYLRVSGLGQVEKDGPVRQREAIGTFCARHNLGHIAEFYEQGVSGTVDSMDRPTFAEMLIKIEALRALPEGAPLAPVGIVIESMDRLARDFMVSELTLRECRKRNIKVFCANQDNLIDAASDDSEPTRKMIRQIMGVLAEWDKSVTVKKLGGARGRIRASGRKCEGAKAYGKDADEQRIRADIQRCRDLGMSYRDIAFTLNVQGDRRRFGKAWDRESVRNIANQRSITFKREGTS